MADVSITPANVVPSSTAVIDKTRNAGVAITAGQTVYLDTNSNWQLADADGAAALRQCQGIAVNGAAAGQPLAVATSGTIAIGGTVVQGKIYVCSNTAGGVAPSSDLATGWYTTILGIATSNANLNINLFYGNTAV